MQLVAYGAQDIYLTGNPQITFFKVVYRRHTNFAMEAIEQTFSGQADFGKRVTALISRNGDLINRIYVQVDLPKVECQCASFRWVDDIGHHLIENVEVEIGGQRIDKQYGTWLQVWSELTVPAGQQAGYKEMIGQGGFGTETQLPGSLQQWSTQDKPGKTLYIPLQFWFNRNVGLSLPLIALQYHEVRINIEFKQASQLVITADQCLTNLSLGGATLYVDYIYLDTDERRRFAQVSHEYLIEQLQFTGEEGLTTTNNRIRLNFNHPVKELIWVVQHNHLIATSDVDDLEGVLANNQWSNFTDVLGSLNYEHSRPLLSGNPTATMKLQLNGHDRFSVRKGSYFNLVQPYQHHSNIPRSPGINVYSFALKPEEHQPSGSANFSRIDTATLQLEVRYANTLIENCAFDTDGLPGSFVADIEPFIGCALEGTVIDAKLRVFAVNYNVLRVMSGMAGQAYSN
jgi:hypothetical protein